MCSPYHFTYIICKTHLPESIKNSTFGHTYVENLLEINQSDRIDSEYKLGFSLPTTSY